METLLLSILKPQQRRYSVADLGPTVFEVKEKVAHRSDHVIQQIPFSYYEIEPFGSTVVYIHSYNSNRLEPMTLIPLLLENNLNVASIELQRVEYDQEMQCMAIHQEGMVSFGYYERQQIGPVMNWLKERSKGKLYLWGRSMGAVTAILYQSKYGGADGLILDSPFHSLHEIFVSQFTSLTRLPRVLGEGTMIVANCTFKNLLRFSINQLQILDSLKIDCPTFIIANPKDSLAGPSSTLIYNKLKGMRKILYSQAEHSASRERPLLIEIISHLKRLQRQKKRFWFKSAEKTSPSITSNTQESQTHPKQKKIYLKLMQVKSAKLLELHKKTQ